MKEYKAEQLSAVEAAYCMAMLFCVADGKYTVFKGKQIAFHWLPKFTPHDFDVEGLNAFLLTYPKASYLSLYKICAETVLLNETPEFHMELIRLLYAMYGADKAEESLFNLTCDILIQQDLKILIAA